MPSEDQSAHQTPVDLYTPTLAALQRLNDATFHRLCDELIPRVDSRYFPLTPHGISPEGLSIKGQPDSFVGDSIATASIALCYSVQKQGWWTKLLDDVKSARVACPVAREVVWATSRDTERDGRRNLRIGYTRQRRKVGQQSLRYSVAGSYRICSILPTIRICASNT